MFNWRYADISETDILDSFFEPVTCILSADAWGLKGKLPGAKHSWIANFDGVTWKTYEITDLETIDIQRGTVLHVGYADTTLKQLIISNRNPGARWFGNVPRLDYVGKFIDIDVVDYPMNTSIDLITNNCNTFVSYVIWKYQIPLKRQYIGHKSDSFWQSYAAK